jgi:hypothetical protein
MSWYIAQPTLWLFMSDIAHVEMDFNFLDNANFKTMLYGMYLQL